MVSRTHGIWLDCKKGYEGEEMAVVRIPRGFSLMKSKRILMDGSAWTARRYIIVILERLKEFAIIFQWEPFDTYNRVTYHGLIVGADLIGLADRAATWLAEANWPKEEVVSRSDLSPTITAIKLICSWICTE
jgi:hypothetical protein